MKRIVLSIGLCLCLGLTAFAQDVTERTENSPRLTKNGYRYLPVKGDYAIGVEATPFLKYLGNMFTNNGTNKAPIFEGVDNTIYGKYFLENDRAIRAKLRINMGKDTYKGVVPNDEKIANSPLNADATALDIKKVGRTDIELRAGYEFRRGHGRVQGFYGGEVGIGFTSASAKYELGNPMTAANQTPSTWNFADVNPTYTNPASRATEVKYGKTFYGTVAGFVGVEYFFAPQLSLGGELNLGITLATRGQDEITSESWDAAANKVKTQTLRTDSWTESTSGVNRSVEAGTTRLFTKTSGQIFLIFHF